MKLLFMTSSSPKLLCCSTKDFRINKEDIPKNWYYQEKKNSDAFQRAIRREQAQILYISGHGWISNVPPENQNERATWVKSSGFDIHIGKTTLKKILELVRKEMKDSILVVIDCCLRCKQERRSSVKLAIEALCKSFSKVAVLFCCTPVCIL